jgi:hypothetical protein
LQEAEAEAAQALAVMQVTWWDQPESQVIQVQRVALEARNLQVVPEVLEELIVEINREALALSDSAVQVQPRQAAVQVAAVVTTAVVEAEVDVTIPVVVVDLATPIR